MSVLQSTVPICSAFSSILAHLVSCTTSSSRNSSTGKVKPGMWIIGHLSAGSWRSQILSRIFFFRTPELQLTFVASLTKILGELVCVESGAHENDFEVISEVEQVPHDDEQHVRLQASLVNFVQHKVTDAGQEPVVQKYCKKKCWFQIRWCDESPIWCVRCLEYCISLKIEVSPSL